MPWHAATLPRSARSWPTTSSRSGRRAANGIRGAQACLAVAQAYPGGMPVMDVGRITGEGDHWVVQGTIRYPDGSDYHVATILEFADGKVRRQTDYLRTGVPGAGVAGIDGRAVRGGPGLSLP